MWEGGGGGYIWLVIIPLMYIRGRGFLRPNGAISPIKFVVNLYKKIIFKQYKTYKTYTFISTS